MGQIAAVGAGETAQWVWEIRSYLGAFLICVHPPTHTHTSHSCRIFIEFGKHDLLSNEKSFGDVVSLSILSD